MFPNRSLLLITFLTSCNVASAAASSTNLRGSGDVSSSITAISPSPVDKEERQLKRDKAGGGSGGGGGGGGNGKNKGGAITTVAATTPATTVAPSIPETGGGAEAPLPGSTPATVAPAVCTSCVDGEICAREGPTSEAQCYTECVDFPLVVRGGETCGTEGDKCVSNLDPNDVYIEWCDCEADGKWGCASK